MSSHLRSVLVVGICTALGMAGVATGATAAVGPGTAPAAGRVVTPAGSHVISATGRSGQRERISLLSGGDEWVLYTESPVEEDGVVPTHRFDRIIARSRAGQQVQLPVLNPADDPDIGRDYQVVGSAVSALGPTVDANPAASVWILPDPNAHVLQLASGSSYIGTSPDGIFYAGGDGPDGGLQVYDESSEGTVTLIGEPFPGRDPRTDGYGFDLRVTADQDHAVFTSQDASGSDVVSYDFHLQSFTPLPGNRVPSVTCSQVFGTRVGCGGFNDDDSPSDFTDEMLSLDGGKPQYVVHPNPSNDLRVGLSAAGMSWIDNGHLHTIADNGTRRRSALSVDMAEPLSSVYDAGAESAPRTIGSAFGAVVVTRHGLRQLAITAGAGHSLHHVVTAPRSPVTAGAFRLDGGRVAWREDAGPLGRSRLEVARINRGVVSHRRTVSTHLGGNEALDVSATVLAFAAVRHGHTGLQIIAQHHSTFIRRFGGGYLDVSGHRVLYVAAPTSAEYSRARLYNAKTGGTRELHVRLRGPKYGVSAAISGNRVVLQRSNGSVWVLNLADGHKTKVRASSYSYTPQVFAHGAYAAWSFPDQQQYRNIETMAPPISLDPHTQRILGLTDAGVLIVDFSSSGVTRYELASYGHTTGRALLSGDVTAPRLAERNILWKDAHHRLRAALLGTG